MYLQSPQGFATRASHFPPRMPLTDQIIRFPRGKALSPLVISSVSEHVAQTPAFKDPDWSVVTSIKPCLLNEMANDRRPLAVTPAASAALTKNPVGFPLCPTAVTDPEDTPCPDVPAGET